MMTGLDLIPCPLSGRGTRTDRPAWRASATLLLTMASSIEHIRSGKLRPLAVTAKIHVDALPGVPTLAEFLPGFEASVWFGIGAPKNTPIDVIDRLNMEIQASFADPKMKAQLAGLGAIPMSMTPADLAGSSPKRPRSGPRWSSSQASRRNSKTTQLPFGAANPSARSPSAVRTGSKAAHPEHAPVFVLLRRGQCPDRTGRRRAPGVGGYA